MRMMSLPKKVPLLIAIMPSSTRPGQYMSGHYMSAQDMPAHYVSGRQFMGPSQKHSRLCSGLIRKAFHITIVFPFYYTCVF
jgi:hypothetical protein